MDTHLEGAVCRGAIVDGSTYLSACTVDRKTDFREVGLDTPRIEPGLKQLLKYNSRRMSWKEWYQGHPFKRRPVRIFWSMSDYGFSTWQVVKVFFLLALIFAALYYFCGLGSGPGIVANLFVDRSGLKVPGALVPVRAIYFSVVTMTTLGFGDMHAYAGSFWGHILLMLQVLLGYVLLGALITRFAVLFQAEGPAGKFSPEYKGPIVCEQAEHETESEAEE